LTRSARISSGNRYSSPAVPKLTNMSFRPRFSTARTKVPSLGKRVPVFCDRIGLLVFNGSPGLMIISVVWLISRCQANAYSAISYESFPVSSPHLIILRLTQARSFNQPVVKQASYQSEKLLIFQLSTAKSRRILTRFRFSAYGIVMCAYAINRRKITHGHAKTLRKTLTKRHCFGICRRINGRFTN
jgi:hypothetical protein